MSAPKPLFSAKFFWIAATGGILLATIAPVAVKIVSGGWYPVLICTSLLVTVPLGLMYARRWN